MAMSIKIIAKLENELVTVIGTLIISMILWKNVKNQLFFIVSVVNVLSYTMKQ